jgi:hypothetical protein
MFARVSRRESNSADGRTGVFPARLGNLPQLNGDLVPNFFAEDTGLTGASQRRDSAALNQVRHAMHRHSRAARNLSNRDKPHGVSRVVVGKRTTRLDAWISAG